MNKNKLLKDALEHLSVTPKTLLEPLISLAISTLIDETVPVIENELSAILKYDIKIDTICDSAVLILLAETYNVAQELLWSREY